MRIGPRIFRLMSTIAVLMLATIAQAQTSGSGAIAGVVRDTSNAVVPGVTVEASSPALIEKVRVVVTDDQGLYRIVDLRPGIYTVTFTLPGFATVRREGIELTSGFTAQVNAELRLGTLEETVTVSGASPIVDVQNVREQSVFSREVLDALPVNKSAQAYATLIPGATLATTAQDVGGIVQGSAAFTVHGGSGDMRPQQGGIGLQNPLSAGGNLIYAPNRASVQEVAIEVGGISAESDTGGVQMNIVPKDGGNTFSGYFAAEYGNGDLQSNNLTPELRARNLPSPNALKKAYDYNVGAGGPFMKDKLWFYTGHRWVGSEIWAPVYWNAEPKTSWQYKPDLTRQAVFARPYQNSSVRLTWQAAQNHKVAVTFENQHHNCNCGQGLAANRAPEAAADHEYFPNTLLLGTWTYPATNRLLFEVSSAHFYIGTNQLPSEGVTPDTIAVEDLATGFLYRARAAGLTEGTSYAWKRARKVTGRYTTSYITGSHAMKAGFVVEGIFNHHKHTLNQDVTYRFRGGVPAEVALWATPWDHSERILPILGIFAQDQWTLRKLTLNLGLRFDSMKASVPEQFIPAGTYVPERRFAPVDGVPDWKDLSPRVGAAYDLTGNGQTAVKISLGRYVIGSGTDGIPSASNPANRISGGATRQWTDANGDFVPQPSELGPLSNARFGQVVTDTTFDDKLLSGFGVRAYTWQGAVSLQHELWQGASINAGYFRTWYGNFLANDNLAITAADHDPYCITAPSNERLPGGGGERICGLYDINPARFGLVENLVTRASDFGTQTQVYNGVDVTVNARFGQGGVLSGGVSTGRTTSDTCEVGTPAAVGDLTYTFVDSPERRFCRVTPPWSASTNLKFYGAYPAPGGIQVSATFQNLPGPQILASYQVTNAVASPSLGRNLSSGRATVQLIEPGTTYEGRITQLDLRFTKMFRVRGARVQGMIDIYNSLNANSILAVNNTYGPSWLSVQQILAGRLFKFGTQVDF